MDQHGIEFQSNMEKFLFRDSQLCTGVHFFLSLSAFFKFNDLLHQFTERTPGSFIEERQASMVWRFWMAGVRGDSPDRQWALRQAAEAQNHIFDRFVDLFISFFLYSLIFIYYNSLGERYGLRIIPGKNSFLVLPNNVSRSTAVGAILHPGGPARSPLVRHGQRTGRSDSVNSLNGGWSLSAGTATPRDDHYHHHQYTFPFSLGSTTEIGGGGDSDGSISIGGGGGEDVDFLLAVSSDEKLLRRLNEFEGSETVSTSGKGTDGKWTLESEDAGKVLKVLGDCVGL